MSSVAVIQMNSGDSVADNLTRAELFISRAVEAGAQLLVLPEMFAFIGVHNVDQLSQMEADGDGPIQAFLAQQARMHQVWLVGGTVPLVSPDAKRAYGACLLYNAQGERVATYNKIHLFDVYIKERDEHYQESEVFCPGERVVVADTPFGKLGLAVCYDLRFPEMFRLLIAQQAEIIALPAAFTLATGSAHWHTLLKARAIENLAYIVAANQAGTHANKRETYGHSLIVSPWGKVEAELKTGTGMASAEIDLNSVREIRQGFPCLSHRHFSVA